jgi:hypothetical protein
VTGDEIQDIVEKMASASPKILAKLQEVSQWHGPAKVVKIDLPKHTGKIVKIVKGGRKLTIDYKGKKVSAKVSGSRTKITVNGKKAKRKAVKMGMSCTFTYPGPGKEATNVDCKG